MVPDEYPVATNCLGAVRWTEGRRRRAFIDTTPRRQGLENQKRRRTVGASRIPRQRRVPVRWLEAARTIEHGEHMDAVRAHQRHDMGVPVGAIAVYQATIEEPARQWYGGIYR